MSLPKFEIEGVFQITGRGMFVFARSLNKKDFFVSEGFLLGGEPIRGGDIPRIVNDEGGCRTDIWGFWLTNPDSASRFTVGEVVELTQS